MPARAGRAGQRCAAGRRGRRARVQAGAREQAAAAAAAEPALELARGLGQRVAQAGPAAAQALAQRAGQVATGRAASRRARLLVLRARSSRALGARFLCAMARTSAEERAGCGEHTVAITCNRWRCGPLPRSEGPQTRRRNSLPSHSTSGHSAPKLHTTSVDAAALTSSGAVHLPQLAGADAATPRAQSHALRGQHAAPRCLRHAASR